ncbi:MAG: hypothetical protein J6A08_03505 [Lachnospiraceae bacterium]|nr:hypothetical protein [Lachnospiraceae bacterium]
MDRNNEDLIVGGYKFATIADAETARMEEQKVDNLEKHLDYSKPQNVLLVYNRAIENKIFLTPVGFAYLRKMQNEMVKWGVPEDKIQPVPLYGTFSNKTENNSSIRRSIAARKPKVEYKGRFITSVLINVIMVLLVISMFVVSWKSDVPNIINYRTAVLNEYSEWEQQLTEREKAVREAEKEYNLTP